MRKVVVLLAFWACISDARRMQTKSDQWQDQLRSPAASTQSLPEVQGAIADPLKALGGLLLAFEAAAAFKPSGVGLTFPESKAMRTRLCSVGMGPKLHGSQQSRSPLVNWYTNEAGIDLEMVAPRPSNHPFQQVPFLTDDGGVEIFESGAILLYLADAYGGASTPQERAQYTKWVVWSNSELDGLCFGAVPGDHRVRGTSMDKADLKSVKVLEDILSKSDWLVNNEFSVADVAVCSYLNYVPIFFQQANLAATPSIVKYMKRCAERPAFAQAFGQGHADLVKSKADEWLASSGPLDGLKNLLR